MRRDMWAQMLIAPHTFSLEQVDAPTGEDLKGGQVLLRVLAGGVCGSDLSYFKGGLPANGRSSYVTRVGSPLHEVVGEVMASRDSQIRVGSRIVGWADRRNAMQEFVIVDGRGVFEYDPALPPETAVMLQSLACVICAVDQLVEVAGTSVAILGQGPIGVLFSHVLKSAGAACVTGVDRVDRTNVAQSFGVDEVVAASSDDWARSLRGESERPSLIIEAVGHQVGTLGDAIEAIAVGGQIYYFGVPDDSVYPFPMMKFLRKNGRFASGVTIDKRGSLVKAADYLKRYPELSDAYISNILRMSEAQEAFDMAVKPSRGQLKIVLSVD